MSIYVCTHIHKAVFITLYVLLSVGSDHANYNVSWIDFGKRIFSVREFYVNTIFITNTLPYKELCGKRCLR